MFRRRPAGGVSSPATATGVPSPPDVAAEGVERSEVVAVNKEGESPPAKTRDPVVAENPYSAPGEPTDLRITDFDKKSVTLR